MKEHLIKQAAEWFDDLEGWNSFIELVPLSMDIQECWLNDASRALRRHFHEKPCPGWSFVAWDGYTRDTWWFLEEFGRDSIGIGYGWRYHLCFGVAYGDRVDRVALAKALSHETYRPLLNAFGRKRPTELGFALEQYGDFSFGLKNDGNVTGHELAWCAGNKTDVFVKQAAAKIEAFTSDPEITTLMRRLNQELLTGGESLA